MSTSIIGLHTWFQTPMGAYLLDWERRQCAAAVVDIFGYHALQLGVPELDALAASRIAHQWLALNRTAEVPQGIRAASLQSEFFALPFSASSLDLVVLPHSLELSAEPHATLREVERVLVPQGRVVICGFNPLSLWGLQHARIQLYQRLGLGSQRLPPDVKLMSYWRLCDWLRLLSFDVESCVFGCYRPGVRSEKWLQRFAWMDQAGADWWPAVGAAYCLVAVKRVRGMRLLGPTWTGRPVRASKTAPLANYTQPYDQLENDI